MVGDFTRGAFISYSEGFLGTVPNVIVFQFNPETMTRSLTRNGAATNGKGAIGDPLVLTGEPVQSYSFKLVMSARDMVADGGRGAAALGLATGVASRMAALQLLQYPVKGASGEATTSCSKTTAAVERMQSPAVLFTWGVTRIIPVIVSSLGFTETLYDERLNPIQAEADVSLQVLTQREICGIQNKRMQRIAQMAARYDQGLRERLALANLVTASDARMTLVPF